MSENLKENRHKTTGMFGWLKSKKKANAKTEAENQQALNRARQQTDRILTSFASDIQQSQERSANQLFQHMEDLVRKESLINEKITQLASEFNAEDSQMRKFCNCEKKYVFDKAPVNEARPLTMDDYQPCCCTPLYDAMGFTLTSMRNHVRNIEDAVVVVTIITDGLENASKEYTGAAVKQLVEQLKGEGWTFTYMGANQDSVEVAFNLSIRNARNFDYSAHGTMAGMAKDTSTRMNFFSRLAHFKENVTLSVT